MGRNKKAKVNEVVWVHNPRYGVPFYGVVIDYQDETKWDRYQIIESNSEGKYHRGPARWHDSTEFVGTGKMSKIPGRVYRKTWRLFGAPEQRGCDCYCCSHIKGAEPDVKG